MIGVAFHFEDWVKHVGTPEPKTSMKRWIGNAKILGADTIFLIDKTTYKIAQYYKHIDTDMDYFRYDDFIEVEEDYPDINKVYFEDRYFLDKYNLEGISLIEYEHPSENVIYVVGPNFDSLKVIESRRNSDWVYIPCKARYALYAESVINIALYDRMLKEAKDGSFNYS